MRPAELPLFWRIVTINGAVFFLGTMALALSPARVSSPVLLSEAVVLLVGLSLMVGTNALLLRRHLAPIDRVIAHMGQFVVGEPQAPLEPTGSGAGARLAASYQAMAARLAEERAVSDAKELAAQEAERHRIAQELHDEIGQRLTVVLLALKRLEGAERSQRAEPSELRAVRESVRLALDEVRGVARRLRPGVLDDLGLHSALAGLVSDVAEQLAAEGVEVRRSFAPGLPALGESADLVVYRVAQEALTNVVRHAGARHVEVSLHRSGSAVVLEVVDDGRGLGDVQEGAGITGMRERARLVRADLDIASDGGRGTRVRLSVPLPEGASA